MLALAEVAQQMALLPLLALAWKRVKLPALWWLAGVFLVSWLADEASRWGAPQLWSTVYPVSQAGIVLGVLLPRKVALVSFAGVLLLALLALFGTGAHWPDLILRAGCWGAIVAALWYRWDLGTVRTSLLVYFGLGLVAWAGYVALPGWTSWGMYQGVRAVGIGLFSWAVLRPERREA